MLLFSEEPKSANFIEARISWRSHAQLEKKNKDVTCQPRPLRPLPSPCERFSQINISTSVIPKKWEAEMISVPDTAPTPASSALLACFHFMSFIDSIFSITYALIQCSWIIHFLKLRLMHQHSRRELQFTSSTDQTPNRKYAVLQECPSAREPVCSINSRYLDVSHTTRLNGEYVSRKFRSRAT